MENTRPGKNGGMILMFAVIGISLVMRFLPEGPQTWPDSFVLERCELVRGGEAPDDYVVHYRFRDTAGNTRYDAKHFSGFPDVCDRYWWREPGSRHPLGRKTWPVPQTIDPVGKE